MHFGCHALHDIRLARARLSEGNHELVTRWMAENAGELLAEAERSLAQNRAPRISGWTRFCARIAGLEKRWPSYEEYLATLTYGPSSTSEIE